MTLERWCNRQYTNLIIIADAPSALVRQLSNLGSTWVAPQGSQLKQEPCFCTLTEDNEERARPNTEAERVEQRCLVSALTDTGVLVCIQTNRRTWGVFRKMPGGQSRELTSKH